jgi:hypothetical protein
LIDKKAKKINAIAIPEARRRRGSERPRNKALAGSEGEKSIPPRIKIATKATKEL